MASSDTFWFRFFVRIAVGPFLGFTAGAALLAFQWIVFGINPLDVASSMKVCLGLGTLGGFIVGVFWAFAATKHPADINPRAASAPRETPRSDTRR